jgi:hypothetical protein
MEYPAPVIVARTSVVCEASVILSLLAGYDIPCHSSSHLPSNLYSLPVEGLTEICIYVPARLAQDARRILEEHRRSHTHLRLVENDDL